MEKAKNISVEECCVYYNIEVSFIQRLNEHGLIELTGSEETLYIAFEQLADLEKYMHMHYELEINMEGMETIKHLLNRINNLQQEVDRLKGQIG